MCDENLKEKKIFSKLIYSGKIIQVEKWTVTLPDNSRSYREIVKHNGAVAIIPLDNDGNVTFIRQYRAAIDKVTIELPAGKLDKKNESILQAAKRELEEETGLIANNWQRLTDIHSSPGFCNEKLSIYLATNLTQKESHPDNGEFVDVIQMPLEDAVQLCFESKIQDSKTIIGLLMANMIDIENLNKE